MPEIVCTLCGRQKHITPSYARQNKTGLYFCSPTCAREYRKTCTKKKGNICAAGQVQA